MITRRQTLKGGMALGALASAHWRATAAEQGPALAAHIWYRQPAEQWTEALPIGNGRLGAMIFGGVARERLQLNEDTLYAGGPYDPSNPEALEALPRVRALIAEGKYVEAQNLTEEKMMARPLAHAVVSDGGRPGAHVRCVVVRRGLPARARISTRPAPA